MIFGGKTVKQVIEQQCQQVGINESFQKAYFFVLECVNFTSEKYNIYAWSDEKYEAHDFFVLKNKEIWLPLYDFHIHHILIILIKINNDHSESLLLLHVKLNYFTLATVNASVKILFVFFLKFFKWQIYNLLLLFSGFWF